MRIRQIGSAIAITACLWGAGPAAAETSEEPIMQIMQIDTHGRNAEYLQLVQRAIARQNAVSPGIDTHIYQASFAGAETGRLLIVLRYPSMTFLVAAQKRLGADAEWNRLTNEVAVQTQRSLLGNSLFVDVTPQP
ncbi:MAG: hypothetical protein QM676_02465 [Novosphingobium sp.]